MPAHPIRLKQLELNQTASEVFHLLKKQKLKIVFAESCTGGMVSSTLTQFPGVSNYHCGSQVVYRLDSKKRWLKIPKSTLVSRTGKDQTVSKKTTIEMARRILKKTPEANLSAAITGYLYSHQKAGAPSERIYIAVAFRNSKRKQSTLFFTEEALRTNAVRRKQQRIYQQLHASLSVFLMVRSLLTYLPQEGE